MPAHRLSLIPEEDGRFERHPLKTTPFPAGAGHLPSSSSTLPFLLPEEPRRMLSATGHLPAFPRRLPAVTTYSQSRSVHPADDFHPRHLAPVTATQGTLIFASAGYPGDHEQYHQD